MYRLNGVATPPPMINLSIYMYLHVDAEVSCMPSWPSLDVHDAAIGTVFFAVGNNHAQYI